MLAFSEGNIFSSEGATHHSLGRIAQGKQRKNISPERAAQKGGAQLSEQARQPSVRVVFIYLSVHNWMLDVDFSTLQARRPVLLVTSDFSLPSSGHACSPC